MSLTAGESVTVVRDGAPTGGTDAQGNPEIGPDVETTTGGWGVAPRAGAETAEPFGQQSIDGLTLYKRDPADVLSTDRVIVRGKTWQVDGDIGDWVSPYDGARRGVVVNLKKVS